MKKTEIAMAVAGAPFERPVLRFLERLKQRLCSHRFAIEDLTMVNRDSDGDDRVEWKCSRCWKVFSAHCGLDISPSNGPTYRRGSSQNTEAKGPRSGPA